MRPTIPAAVAAAALLALGLTACSGANGSAGTSSAKGCPAAPSGSVSESVKVSGASTKEPTVTVPKKLAVKKTERTVVSGGKGATVKVGASISWSYALYNGTSGKKIGAVGYGSQGPQTFTVSTQAIPGLAKALSCTTVGSRLVAVIPPAEAFGSSGQSQLGIGKNDDLVVIADVRGISPTKADGAPQKAPAGFPTVQLAKSGKPTVTITDQTAPATTQVGLLKKGSGKTVADGDSVTVQYQGLNLRTKKVFDQSWGRGPTQFPTSGVIPGFTKALVGQKVGSQVIAVIPPAEGYGAKGQPSAGIQAGDTLVFVIDILGTSPSS